MSRKKVVWLLAGHRYEIDAKLENGGTWSFVAGFSAVKLVGTPAGAQGQEVQLVFDNGVEIDAIAVAGWKVREQT